jgi:anthranilate synthase component 1
VTLRSLVRRLDGALEPLRLYRALCDDGRRPNTLLLESADPESGRERRSLIVLSSALSVSCAGERVTIAALNENGEALLPCLAEGLAGLTASRDPATLTLVVPRPPAHPADHERLRGPSTLGVVRKLLGLLGTAPDGVPESVFLAGLFAYDLVEQFERLPAARHPRRDVPDFHFYLADRLLLVDHLRRRTEVIASAFGGAAREERSARADLARLVEHAAQTAPALDDSWLPIPEPAVDCDDARFAGRVRALQRHIVAGEVFQVVPSRSFTLPCPDPLAAYEQLRRREPVPYLFFVNAADFTLFGASPESALRVDGPARTLELSPIAGTRPRGRGADGRLDPELDVRLEVELRLDPKEQAEHLMLVDLARNDVARVSRPGTRQVAELLRVERFAHVMHLVSRVRGQLADDLDALHACQALFPMGTLTGAPKLRAMELLRRDEPGYRGAYGGAVGYLLGDGSLDAAIVIRAALVRDGIARVTAGAGVVHDSVPEREAEETRRKAETVLRAIVAANTRTRIEPHVA